MGFGDVKTGKKSTGFGSVGRSSGGVGPSDDLSTTDGLVSLARKSGFGEEAEAIAEPKPKLSLLQRLGKGLGAFNPAEAILTGSEKGFGKGIGKYISGVFQGIGSAITGTDYEGERRTFADVAEKLGVENSIAKFGIGFIGDVLLDPSTYFGGALARGILKGVGKVGTKALSTIGKIAPDVEAGLRLAGEGLQDALGRAFQFGYGASKGAREDVLTFMSREQQAKLGIAASNLNRLGTGALTKEQSEELALRMIAGKRAEFTQRALSEDIAQSTDALVPFRKKAERMLENRQDHLLSLEKEIDRLNQKGVVAATGRDASRSVPGGITGKTSMVRETILPSVIKETAPKTFDELTNAYSVKDILRKEFGSFKSLQQDVELGGWSRLVDLGIDPTTARSIANQIFKAPLFKPARRILEDIPATLGTRETRSFVERMITQPKSEVERIKRLIGTREGWKKTLLDDIDNLRNEYENILKEEQATYQAADEAFAARGEVAREATFSGITDPKVKAAIEGQIARGKKFAEDLDLQNPYETYFPFIKNDKLQKFLGETQGIKVGSEGYRKQFKNLLTNENLEKNPAKAFFTRESQIVHNQMTRDFLAGFVKKHGKPLDAFGNSDEAAKAGYQLIKEKGVFGKELGYVNKYDSALIRDGLTPEFQTVNMLAKATGFDAITSLFKRSVTGLFLPFHVRNMVSGHIQNFEALGAAALNPKNIAVGQKIAYIMAKGGKVPKEFKPFVARFSGDTFYQNDFLTALEKGKELKQLAPILSKETFKETARTFGLGQEAAPFKAARAVGQFIEHQQKATAYITALSQGKGVDEALRLAEMAGFDYRALTRFESQILRRIIPFYSFTRKNVELQLKTLGENPQRINQIIRFFDNAAQAAGEEISSEEYEALPDYIKDKFILKTGEDSKGNPKYSSTGFGTPLEAFADSLSDDPIRKLASQMNPVLKVPLERAFGKDFFQNRDLKEVVDAKAYQILPDTVKDFINFTEIDKKDKKGNPYKEYRADPEKLHILRNLPTSRLFGYLYDIYSDNEPSDKTLTLATGVRPKPIDLDTVKYFRERDKQRELEDFLVQLGILKRFEKAYKPK